jgi:hypothetical protein
VTAAGRPATLDPAPGPPSIGMSPMQSRARAGKTAECDRLPSALHPQAWPGKPTWMNLLRLVRDASEHTSRVSTRTCTYPCAQWNVRATNRRAWAGSRPAASISIVSAGCRCSSQALGPAGSRLGTANDNHAMRPTPDLAKRPFTFTQLGLLNPGDFIKHARERGIVLAESQLEALHQSGVLVPLLRASRDGRSLRARVQGDVRTGNLSRLTHVADNRSGGSARRGPCLGSIYGPWTAVTIGAC